MIGKESGFEPQNEDCYDGTSNDRIRKLFGSRVPSNDVDLNELETILKSINDKKLVKK